MRKDLTDTFEDHGRHLELQAEKEHGSWFDFVEVYFREYAGAAGPCAGISFWGTFRHGLSLNPLIISALRQS
jgi:hypothetical protein